MDLFSLSIEALGEVIIKSASGFEEKVIEAPTAVTIISEQMIVNSGVYTLRDLLTLYVPSFVQVQDQNEYNVSFRGIYTSSQQKFLILLNGHRLNSRAYSMANPDHAISLEKIKRIEVLRGPGSSVHGNIALTSVVNIISKSGESVAGFVGSTEFGNYGYKELYFEFGNKKNKIDYFSWFKFVESDGEKVLIKPEDDYSPKPNVMPVYSVLDGFFNEASYDLGLTIKVDDSWSFLVNHRQGHYIEPLTTGGISGEAYSIKNIPLVNGVSPGAMSTWWHYYLKNDWNVNNRNNLHIKVYYDSNDIKGPVVINAQTNAFVDVAWQEYDYGLSVQWLHDFNWAQLLLGIDFDDTKLTNSQATAGSNGVITGPILFNGEPVLKLGKESILSTYLQYKQPIFKKLKLNAGVRFDAKKRLTGTDIKEVSPRIALLYNKGNSIYKLSYAKSFVDPPYWNRYSSFASFRGSSDLKPEILKSIQFTPEFHFLNKRSQLKFNLYHNEYTDIVFRKKTALPNEPLFINAGKLKTIGIEPEFTYQFEKRTFRFIGSYYKIKKSEGYSADNNEIYNIPRYQFNLIFDQKLNDIVSYQLSLKYIGSRKSPINIAFNNVPVEDPFPNEGVEYQVPENMLPPTFLSNMNIRWQIPSLPMVVTFNVKNIFDKTWRQGGTVVHPYQQTGRWFKFGAEYKF
ncbi:TonB-dependent receptor plug domain-containing protein [Pseudoalteromonas denitrificans]|uniref:Iron complex outermembrane recepter protein n=1 Tax=Pseudoalteromonas denitrificans DSM 6059 TaxID=1123010 RepID=A0A1I1ES37_9GAMM|nr:TonB-dependent receptor [Pseudoalteromonas denitrificans]SFB89944.1 iron complex outermembrane recepter protein [Pseudoalteromonas denitrificans DSM 6059]